MKKNSKGFGKGFRGQRGLIAGAVLLITGALSLVVMITFASIMAKVTSRFSLGYAAVEAAGACRDWVDGGLRPWGGIFTCTTGQAIRTSSTKTAISCVESGETGSTLTIGTTGDCSCMAVFKDISADSTHYIMEFIGTCGGTGNTDKYTATTYTEVSKCPNCNQACPLPPVVEGGTCGDASCNLTCPGCCDAGLDCTGGTCVNNQL